MPANAYNKGYEGYDREAGFNSHGFDRDTDFSSGGEDVAYDDGYSGDESESCDEGGIVSSFQTGYDQDWE